MVDFGWWMWLALPASLVALWWALGSPLPGRRGVPVLLSVLSTRHDTTTMQSEVPPSSGFEATQQVPMPAEGDAAFASAADQEALHAAYRAFAASKPAPFAASQPAAFPASRPAPLDPERAARRAAEQRAAQEAAERAAAKRAEAERIEAAHIEAARQEAARLAAARIEAARREAERQEARRADAARLEAERAEALRRAAEAARAEAERQAARAEQRAIEAERRAAQAAEEQVRHSGHTRPGTLGRVAQAMQARQAAQAPARAAPRTPAAVLVMVVDDSKVVRVKTGRVLAAQGFRVVQAEDGTDALAKVGAELPHVVITDVEMPGMDGLELTRRLRAAPATRNLPVVMVTSSDERLRGPAAEAGVTVLLGKPYEETELIAHVAQLARLETTPA